MVIDDALESGQSAAASLGVQYALQQGFQRVLCVPGDCPALDPAELEGLLSAHAPHTHSRTPRADGSSGVTIIPDRHGSGTNGLLLAPPDAIAPSFGPDSCERHRGLALTAGIVASVEPLSSLVLDIDTGADLDALRERLRGHSERAARTRAVLGQPERTEIISIQTTG